MSFYEKILSIPNAMFGFDLIATLSANSIDIVRLGEFPRVNPGQNGTKLRPVWDGFAPQMGRRIQPRVSSLGTLKLNEFALKGREADRMKLAPIAAKI
jgi:hypothetical protein